MPIYEYLCPQCNKKFEELNDMEDRASEICPGCKTESPIVPSMFDFKLYNFMTKDGEGFKTEYVHPGKLQEMQQENRRK